MPNDQDADAPQREPLFTDQHIADHRMLSEYLRTKPGMNDDLARRWSAAIIANPGNTDEYLLEEARQAQAQKKPQHSDPYLNEMLQRRDRLLQSRQQYQQQEAEALRARRDRLLQMRQQAQQQQQQMLQRRDMLNQAHAQAAQPQQPMDPQVAFMTKTAPIAAALSKHLGIDAASSALITAQLFGAKPQATTPSDAEIMTGAQQALNAFSGPGGAK
jgi:hypothetical protein